MSTDADLLKQLVCPEDRGQLAENGPELVCPDGHTYPVIDGIPVMLTGALPPTFQVLEASRLEARRNGRQGPLAGYYIDTLGISEAQKARLSELLARGEPAGVDPVVSFLVGATNGIAYRHLVGQMQRYPIPQMPLPPGGGRVLLDIGCGWGRWSIAAARLGYRPIGVDPSLGALMAARRAASKLGLKLRFVCADARQLPFRAAFADTVFSYSVLQHFSKEDCAQAVQEIGRVLRPGGNSSIQMPNVLGLRCLYHQARRGFRKAKGFEVRYWSLAELSRVFSQNIGKTEFSVEAFIGIGLQASDLEFMPFTYRAVIRFSELVRKSSRSLPLLRYAADSVYVKSTKTYSDDTPEVQAAVSAVPAASEVSNS